MPGRRARAASRRRRRCRPRTATRFAANALGKARAAAAALGPPGDRRRLRDRGGRARRRARDLLRALRRPVRDATPRTSRSCAPRRPPGSALRYVCVMAYASPAARSVTFTGTCEGTLAADARGDRRLRLRPGLPARRATRTAARWPSSPTGRRTRSRTAAARRARCSRGWWSAGRPAVRVPPPADRGGRPVTVEPLTWTARSRPPTCASRRARRRSALLQRRRGDLPGRPQARHGPRHRLAGLPRGSRALRDRPRRRAAHALRDPGRAPAARPGAQLRPRQGGAPRGARGERRAAARGARDRLPSRPAGSSRAAPRASRRPGGRSWCSAIVIAVDLSRTVASLAQRAPATAHQRSRRTRSTSRPTSPARSRSCVGTIFVAMGHDVGGRDRGARGRDARDRPRAAARLAVDRRAHGPHLGRTPRAASAPRSPACASRVELRRIRVRHAAGRAFADLVVGVAPDKGVGQAHATADDDRGPRHACAGQRGRRRPRRAGRARGRAARARDRGGGDRAGGPRGPQRARDARRPHYELSLHVKLPRELSLAEAHDVIERLEHEVHEAVPELTRVHTHIEPLARTDWASAPPRAATALERAAVEEAVRGHHRRAARGNRASATPSVAASRSSPSRCRASSRCRRRTTTRGGSRRPSASAAPSLADVIVHTEPESGPAEAPAPSIERAP